jgi:hypothetical protein
LIFNNTIKRCVISKHFYIIKILILLISILFKTRYIFQNSSKSNVSSWISQWRSWVYTSIVQWLGNYI